MFRFGRKSFFDAYRKAFGSLDQQEVDGLEFLLGQIEADPHWKHIEEIAYVLATTKHETANTFQPIREYRAKAGTKARRVQDAYWGTGFFGRGFVQLTHKANYARAGKEFGLDLVGNPDLALKPDTAYKVLSTGMREGWFTRKKLADFINKSEVDYVHARKIVNGLDEAALIAGYAEKFEHILRSSQVKDSSTPIKAEPAKSEVSVTPVVTEKKGVPVVNVEHAEKVDAAVPPPPGEVKVQSLAQSLLSKVMAGGTAVMGVLTAIFGFFTQAFDKHPLPMTILVLGILAISAYMWNESKKRRDAREALIVQKAASQTENTVRLE